jgi:hypothetical protein
VKFKDFPGILVVISIAIHSCLSGSPNIVLILTDDQDLLLKSIEYLPKTNNLLTNKGSIFSNAVSILKITKLA